MMTVRKSVLFQRYFRSRLSVTQGGTGIGVAIPIEKGWAQPVVASGARTAASSTHARNLTRGSLMLHSLPAECPERPSFPVPSGPHRADSVAAAREPCSPSLGDIGTGRTRL